MKKIVFVLLIFACNSVFAQSDVDYKPVIVFSDSHYEKVNKRYTPEILDFTVSESMVTYSVVSLIDAKTEEYSYKLFTTEDGVVSSFDFPEVSKFKELTKFKSASLGKVGFASDGSFMIPFQIGNVDRSFLLYRYSPKDRRVDYLGNFLAGQNAAFAFFENDVLYFSNKNGKVHYFTEDFSETKNIKDLYINEIYDMKVEGNSLYILATKRIEGSYKVVLFTFDRDKLVEKSKLVLKDMPLHSAAKYEMTFISKKELVITYNPHRAPSSNSVAYLNRVNLETNTVDYNFELKRANTVNITLACNKNKKTSAVAYSTRNEWVYDLVTGFNGQEIILNKNTNELISQLRTGLLKQTFYVLSVYEKIVGRKAYSEIAIYHLEPDGLHSCEIDS